MVVETDFGEGVGTVENGLNLKCREDIHVTMDTM